MAGSPAAASIASPSALISFAILIVILTASFVALIVWLSRGNFKDRMLLWFGLVSLVYSTRELARSGLVDAAFGLATVPRVFFISWMDFVILLPAALFFEEVFGLGWRNSIRWAAWAIAAYAAVAIVLGLLTGNPYVLHDPTATILLPLIVIVILVNTWNGYRRPSFPDLPILLTGVSIFGVFVLSSHLLPFRYRAEPIGFVVLLASLGAVALRRTLRNESKLLDVERELAAARRIQASILPSAPPAQELLSIATRYSPMTSVAGDFYDFADLGPNNAGVLVADVAGHGVPAALIASMVKVAFAAQQAHAGEPGRVLEGLNQIFCRQLRGQYVTAAYLAIDLEQGQARYAGAGHPPLLLWRSASGQIERFENNGLFLGFRASERYPEIGISLSPGDRLLLYTDGLLEASNAAGDNFGDVLDEKIAHYGDLDASAFADALLADLRAWTRGSALHQQEDDLTLIVLDVGAPVKLPRVATPPQTARA